MTAKRDDQVDAEFYATIKPTFGARWDKAKGRSVNGVSGARCTGITQKRPAKPDGVVVKLTLRFNEQAFMPLQPQAVIEIPDSMVQIAQVVEVEAEDENGAGVAEHLAKLARGVKD